MASQQQPICAVLAVHWHSSINVERVRIVLEALQKLAQILLVVIYRARDDGANFSIFGTVLEVRFFHAHVRRTGRKPII